MKRIAVLLLAAGILAVCCGCGGLRQSDTGTAEVCTRIGVQI